MMNYLFSSNQKKKQLTFEEKIRYNRQIILEEIGIEGQRKLNSSRVLIIGMGGLGSPVAMYLAAAGVGVLGIVDFDSVNLSNLQRQIIHDTAYIGCAKVESAKKRIMAINPNIEINTYNEKLQISNAEELIQNYDIVICCADNAKLRYIVNDICIKYKKPNVYGAISGFEGQASVFMPGQGPCYRCLYPVNQSEENKEIIEEKGVIAVLPGLIGIIQATEAIKIIVGCGDILVGRMIHVDLLSMSFSEFNTNSSYICPMCSKKTDNNDVSGFLI